MKNDKDSGFKLNYAAYANSIRAKPLLKEASPACPVPIASDKQEKLRVLDILRTFDTQIKDEQVLFSNQHLNRSNTFTYRPSPKKSEPRASAINQKVETAASVSIKERLALLQSSPTKVSPTGQLAAGQSLSKLPDKLSQCVTSKVGIKQTQSLTGINPKHPTQTQKFKLEEEKTIEQIIAEHTKVDIMPVSERFKFFGALANKGSKPPLPASKSIFQPLKLQQLPVVLEVKASFSESNLGPDSTIIGTYKEAQTQSNLQIKQKDEIKTKDPNKMTISERRQYFQEKSAGISQVVPKISAPKKITRSEIIALSLPPIVEEPSKEMDSKRNDSGAFVEMEPICEEFLTGFNFDVMQS